MAGRDDDTVDFREFLSLLSYSFVISVLSVMRFLTPRGKKRCSESKMLAGKRKQEVMEIDPSAGNEDDIDVVLDKNRPHFPAAKKAKMDVGKELRKVAVPSRRYTPLREDWMKIYTPLVEHLGLQVRFNTKSRNVELKACAETEDASSLQRGADFVKAYVLGFAVEDALALLRLDDLFVESFDVQDVKPLKGDHLSRAIGRLAGKGGRTKFTIENVSKTRIVLADSKVHVLGSYQNIAVARRAICNLVLGKYRKQMSSFFFFNLRPTSLSRLSRDLR
ncbi:unnamed protein product [Notodromas monacha]|uniref:K Homology domain-containing protein n=1 Tax=Notodromas monacha TaxID=399045 RepID=A0A7R9GJL1_9CRUS|nr:unnamed protein product [Notodromas monacha]CAG0922929.1 unnamed protein product [Notodromas monacha]